MIQPPIRASQPQSWKPKAIAHIDDIFPQYDGYIIDLWGVIHDGVECYAGVHATLTILQNLQKHVIFLSNAPRRVWRAEEKLAQLGITRSMYQAIDTSGEAVYDWFRDTVPFAPDSAYGILGPARDDGLLDGLPYRHTHDIGEAAFLLATGYDDDDSPENEKDVALQAALQRGLPLICANPDDAITRKTGVVALCAGIIAERYQAMGGQVISFGKPYPEVYVRCRKLLGDIEKSRIVAIGDNLRTDIRGGIAAGIDTVLVAEGMLHHPLTEGSYDVHSISKNIENRGVDLGAMPRYWVPRFGRVAPVVIENQASTIK